MDKNIIKKILNIIIFVGIIFSAVAYLHYNIYEHDDFAQAFFTSNSIKQLILTADHGRYISWVVMKSVVHGSSILMHIHPQDNLYIAQAIKGLNFAILFYMISKMSYIKSKANAVNPLLYLCVTFVSLFLIAFDNFRVMNFYNQHFAYILNLIFFYPPLYIFGNYFINNKLPEKKDLFKNCVWAFLLGISAHFNIVTFVGLLFFTSIYLLIKNRKKLNDFFLKIIDYKIYVPITVFVTGVLCSFCSKHFLQLFLEDRHPEGSRFLYMIKDFSNFTKEWFYYVFCKTPNNLLITIIISISLFLIIKIMKSKNYEQLRTTMLAWGIIFGAAFFNYSLISCGRTFYDGHSYWLVHHDIKLITNFYFLTALTILISQLFKFIKNKKSFYIISLVCAIGLLLSVSDKYKKNYYKSIINRRLMYECEKAFAFSHYKGFDKTIVPKNNILEKWITEGKLFQKNYALIHGFEPTQKILFVSRNVFYSSCEKNGLSFSEQELKNTKFTDLLDKDFVLQGKQNSF